VDATAQLLETQGYHGTGMNQIIQESGAPRGSLYHYFPDGKEELAAAAIMQQAQVFAAFARSVLAEAPDARAAILRFIDQVIGHLQSSAYCGGAPMAAVALETAATSDRLRQACEDAYAALHAPFIECLTSGGYTLERAASLATLINAALEGAVILSRTQRSTEPLHQVRAEVAALLDCSRPK
jgi:TetR/AcrR family transcriptional repressor of lmrAB and yxaGH operons